MSLRVQPQDRKGEAATSGLPLFLVKKPSDQGSSEFKSSPFHCRLRAFGVYNEGAKRPAVL